MASLTRLTFLAIVVLLLQAPWCAVAQQAGNAAVMALTSFQQGQSSRAECDDLYHSDQGLIAALSTDWYGGGVMCHKLIRIMDPRPNGLYLDALVLDECDTNSGCKDDMIATSKRVWEVLGFDTDLGEVNVTWAIV